MLEHQKTLAPYVKPFKIVIFEVAVWEVPENVVPPNYVRVFVSELSLDIKDAAP